MQSHDSHSHSSKRAPLSVFLAVVVVVFFTSLSAADSVGFVPSYIDGSTPAAAASEHASSTPGEEVALSSLPELGDTPERTADAVLPERLLIPSIGVDLEVQNPDTRDIEALDALLVNGPARYVDSAELNEKGTMIIFAHSSHLPVVHNQMFKAFNRIPELKAGDLITVEGGGTQYLYAVTGVKKADVSDTKIDTSPVLGTRLVLVTCDTLTGKSARYVLEASYVGSYAL